MSKSSPSKPFFAVAVPFIHPDTSEGSLKSSDKNDRIELIKDAATRRSDAEKRKTKSGKTTQLDVYPHVLHFNVVNEKEKKETDANNLDRLIEPQSKLVIIAHGNPKVIGLLTDKVTIKPAELAAYFTKALKGPKENYSCNIEISSCNSGHGKNPFAKKFHKEMIASGFTNITVTGINGFIAHDGEKQYFTVDLHEDADKFKRDIKRNKIELVPPSEVRKVFGGASQVSEQSSSRGISGASASAASASPILASSDSSAEQLSPHAKTASAPALSHSFVEQLSSRADKAASAPLSPRTQSAPPASASFVEREENKRNNPSPTPGRTA